MDLTQETGSSRRDLSHGVPPAPYPVLAVRPDGVVAELNEAARAILGEITGDPPRDAVPPWLAAAIRTPERTPPTGTAPIDGAPAAHGLIGERAYEAHLAAGAGTGDSAAPDVTLCWLLDVTERDMLVRELAAERERTALLSEASGLLSASLNLERCMEVTARLATRYLADAAVVIVPPLGRSHPVAYCGPDGIVDHQDLVIDPADVPGLTEAMQGFPPVPSRWIDPASAPDWVRRDGLRDPAAMVVTALPGHGFPAGALVLLRRSGRAAFTEREEAFARLFAARAGAAMSAARLYAEQTSITETLMRDLLPPRTRELDGVELAARYRPAGDGERVGGDFYDVHPADGTDPDGESLVVLGDVCGKGLEAAVLTGKIRTALRALLPMAGDHGRVLRLLNATLLNVATARFVTLVLASIRREGSRVVLRLTSAGHAPPLIVRSDGTVEEAATGGSLIGVLEDITSTSATVVLDPGDTCLLYTDGITEAHGGPLGDEMFGDLRLRAELGRCGGMPPEALVERVHMLAAQWAGAGPHDDIALVAITAPRRLGSGGTAPRMTGSEGDPA
ncbi:PP2C family protein-serine/threonine phosphatase [Spirillospora albida]|uniref:PP2C family protein-serine/threonine phosphatase n=1 Tax=Spirillospora albida TaxID=58123 RepID=UPI00068FFE56|nr:PP2C family protein-serine/threonine phosphatase [Spirillospora albida]